MADIKTRDAVKGTIKTIDKAAIASERMKSVYAKTKDKAEQGYYAEEGSATEYAADKLSYTADRVKDEGIHQFNKQGQKSVQATKGNIVKAKEKAAEFQQKRAAKAAEKKKARASAEQNGSQLRNGTVSHSSAPDTSADGKSQLIKTRRQGRKTIKTTAQNAEKTVKSTAKGTIKTAEKSVKTAQATSKTAIKTTQQTAKSAQAAAKASAMSAQKAAQAAKVTAKATAEATKATVRAAVSAVRAIIAGTKALISAIIAGGWIAVLIILIVVMLGSAVSLFGGGSESNSYTPVSAEVEAYEPLIQKYAKQHGIPEYVELIKAVMMQESGGRGNDPMQASECGYNTRYPNTPNGITDPEYSINVGIQNLAACLSAAEVENPIDMERIKLALQGYNFGNGYISWAKTNYGGYSYANAVEFSTIQAERLGWESYGDTQYVSHVLRYYPYGRAFTSGGNQAIVEVALTQLGNEGGQPYWSWYGFDSREEWCACFVSWCANQCGYIESGILPKFSLCSNGVNWFKSNGQWQDKNYEPQAGDIIFYDWNGDGTTDHVGIVEKAENGMVYTVEGNTSDAAHPNGDVVAQHSYSIGSSFIFGYGTPAY
ncbi:lysozyme family protein [[Clostridium] innocuum]|uniref:lysozyme family protein n=1 Tax=Clostridium innocuum TaxID=1522 RepID=UPI0032D56263